MRTLTYNEIQYVSGAEIHPSDWLFPAAVGTLAGVWTFAITASSANPVSFSASSTAGFAIGASFGMAYDFLREFDM